MHERFPDRGDPEIDDNLVGNAMRLGRRMPRNWKQSRQTPAKRAAWETARTSPTRHSVDLPPSRQAVAASPDTPGRGDPCTMSTMKM